MSYGSLQDKQSLAQDAYGRKDVNLSRIVHEQRAVEGHRTYGDFLKSLIYGGVDGVLTTFAIISGAAGGGLAVNELLIIGISNLAANAFSMGIGDTTSTLAYHEHVLHERDREVWEFQNFPEGEIEEMVELYARHGLPRDEAKEVVETMAKYEDFFVDVMVSEELKLTLPREDDNPYVEGLITFASFMVFGFLPLAGFIAFPYLVPSLSEGYLFFLACGVTVVVLFVLGSIKSRFSTRSACYSGFEYLVLGSLVAAVAYLIGLLVDSIVGEYFEALHGK